jgi:protein SCO1/2
MGKAQHGDMAPSTMNVSREPHPVGLIGRRQWMAGVAALCGGGGLQAAQAAEAEHHHDHAAHMAQMAKMEQAAQGSPGAAPAAPGRQVSYRAPGVPMLDQRGRKVAFNAALDDGRPVILNFIFTSCTTICPVMTQIFAQVQTRLSAELDKVHMVSVSIDPEYDTPGRLLAYTQQVGSGPQWDFYTGSVDASIQVQKAFDAYRGDKMNHEPVVLLRGRRGSPWTRLDGFASADAIVGAYRSVTS